MVIDPAHDADVILAAVGERRVSVVVCTHGHNDHVNAAVEVAAATEARDRAAPRATYALGQEYGDLLPDIDLARAARSTSRAVRSPSCTLRVTRRARSASTTRGWAPVLRRHPVPGGPGATGRSYSDFLTIIASIRDRLLTLPPSTVVHTGHGDDTTIGAEAPHLAEWVARGH